MRCQIGAFRLSEGRNLKSAKVERSLSVILCARHNERQGAYYAEQIEESRP